MAEGLVKIVGALEIVAAVLFGLAEHTATMFDEVEDDFAEVFAAANTPFVKDEQGHGPERTKRVIANALKKLLACDVPVLALRPVPGVLVDALLREVQGLPDEGVDLARVAGVGRDDPINDFLKVNGVHSALGQPPQ